MTFFNVEKSTEIDLYPSFLSSPLLTYIPPTQSLKSWVTWVVCNVCTGIFRRHSRDTYTEINKFNKQGKLALAETLIKLCSYTVLNMQNLELMRRWLLLAFF